MNYRNATTLAVAWCFVWVVLAASLVGTAHASPVHARSVAYSARYVDASAMATLPPGASVTFTRPCPYARGLGYAFTEYNAYTRTGGAMGGQSWWHDATGTVLRSAWRYVGTRTFVTFDGVTFRNHTRHTVMVAGWCG